MSIAIDSATNKGSDLKATDEALHVAQGAAWTGNLQQFNRVAGGVITKYSTAGGSTANTVVCALPCVYYGSMILTTGSGQVNIWDGITSAGTTITPMSTPPTSGMTFWPAAGPGGVGIGIMMNTGLTIQCSTAGTVLYPLIAPSS